MPRITITSDQAHDLEGFQVARDVNGRLQRGFVTWYANSVWTVKYVDRVPTSPAFREHVLGEETVDLSTLNTLVERRCKDDFPGHTSAGAMWASDADNNAELVTLLAGCTDEWKAEFKDRKTPNWYTRPMEDLSGRDKIDVEQWVRIHHTDPRSKYKLQTLYALQQTSILEYCEANVHFVCKPTSLPGGVASREYKMRFGQVEGWTIENMVKDSNHKVRAGGQTAGDYLLWVCDATKGFTWRWKDIDHVHLLLGLWDQYCTKEKQGLKLEVHTGNGEKTLDV
jgi:hypothetical protein